MLKEFEKFNDWIWKRENITRGQIYLTLSLFFICGFGFGAFAMAYPDTEVIKRDQFIANSIETAKDDFDCLWGIDERKRIEGVIEKNNHDDLIWINLPLYFMLEEIDTEISFHEQPFYFTDDLTTFQNLKNNIFPNIRKRIKRVLHKRNCEEELWSGQ